MKLKSEFVFFKVITFNKTCFIMDLSIRTLKNCDACKEHDILRARSVPELLC